MLQAQMLEMAARPCQTSQFLLARAYRPVPEQSADDALRFLPADRRRLNLGGHEQYDTRQVIAAISPILTDNQQT